MIDKIRIWRTLRRNKTAIIGFILLFILISVAVFAPLISPNDPLEQNLSSRLAPPGKGHLLGTDNYGRDYFSRIIYGSRISLLVGLLAVLLAMIVGSTAGMTAAFLGGVWETIVMRAVDIMMSFPTLVMGLIVMVILGHGLINLIFGIAIVLAPRFARVAHGPTLSIKERDFISACEAIGMSKVRALTKHILPNIFGEILVIGTLWMATAIRIEASLSFLGLGVSPPTPTWGNMIRTGIEYLNLPWLSAAPGLAVMVTALSFNMIGDGIRDITDPKLW